MFLVEGNKLIQEVLESFPSLQVLLYTTTPEVFKNIWNDRCHEIALADLRKISHLQNPSTSILLCTIPERKLLNHNLPSILLDGVRDPGNFGTILRIADWFGWRQIVASEDSADVFHPKVVQASMGSVLRVEVHYIKWEEFLAQSELPVISTAMDGENIYQTNLPKKFHLVLGNEGSGVGEFLHSKSDMQITIPKSEIRGTSSAESLNVAASAGVLLGEIFRSQHYQ